MPCARVGPVCVGAFARRPTACTPPAARTPLARRPLAACPFLDCTALLRRRVASGGDGGRVGQPVDQDARGACGRAAQRPRRTL
eukprot:4348014-Prymnesium_polylepis.1